ncbi:hypothetical protein EUGRSUZ_G00802 [Eucalyptus grandis]|uniref:Uncharacterized protein n=2 Tax=Eucalyptus grandis TaxID=71139 RepID=A0ACC3K1H0_EUCGR|nr:hypothetical protein EUGRSUZ_G00802 [Eucalyptus grandis]
MAVSIFLDWLPLNGVHSCGIRWECSYPFHDCRARHYKQEKNENLWGIFLFSMNLFNQEVVLYNVVYVYAVVGFDC